MARAAGDSPFVLQQFDPARALSPEYRMKKPFPKEALLSFQADLQKGGSRCYLRNL
jgi:hypothetical protein